MRITPKKIPHTDALGIDIPYDLRDVFAEFVKLRQTIRYSVRNIDKALGKLSKSPGGDRIDPIKARAELLAWEANIRALAPFAVCPYCASQPVESKACPCNGMGWLTVQEYQAVQEADPRVKPWRKPVLTPYTKAGYAGLQRQFNRRKEQCRQKKLERLLKTG